MYSDSSIDDNSVTLGGTEYTVTGVVNGRTEAFTGVQLTTGSSLPPESAVAGLSLFVGGVELPFSEARRDTSFPTSKYFAWQDAENFGTDNTIFTDGGTVDLRIGAEFESVVTITADDPFVDVDDDANAEFTLTRTGSLVNPLLVKLGYAEKGWTTCTRFPAGESTRSSRDFQFSNTNGTTVTFTLEPYVAGEECQSLRQRYEAPYRVGRAHSATVMVTPDGSSPSGEFNTLIGADNRNSRGIFSYGGTMYVSDSDDDQMYAYNLFSKANVTGREFDLATNNQSPVGIWTNGETMWVADNTADKLFAYRLVDDPLTAGNQYGDHDSDRDISVTGDESEGIWSDGETMWVVDTVDDHMYAFNLRSKARDESKEFDLDSDNGSPRDIWSNGVTMWVADSTDDKVYAYEITPRSGIGTRDSGKDITLSEGHDDPYGIWSNGVFVWVSDTVDDKIYVYTPAAGFFD